MKKVMVTLEEFANTALDPLHHAESNSFSDKGPMYEKIDINDRAVSPEEHEAVERLLKELQEVIANESAD